LFFSSPVFFFFPFFLLFPFFNFTSDSFHSLLYSCVICPLCSSLQSASRHFTSLHFTSLRFTSLHFTSQPVSFSYSLLYYDKANCNTDIYEYITDNKHSFAISRPKRIKQKARIVMKYIYCVLC
jgi:hypothetical protein